MPHRTGPTRFPMDRHLGSDQAPPEWPCWNLWRDSLAKYITSIPFKHYEDPAVGLFNRLATTRTISPQERAILSIAFVDIRRNFGKKFDSGSNRPSLTVYLEEKLPLEKKYISERCTKFVWHGERNKNLCEDQKHPGIILVWDIPYDP